MFGFISNMLDLHFQVLALLLTFFKFFFFYCLFIFESVRQSASGGGAEREREMQNPKQAPVSKLSAQSVMRDWNPQTLRS